MKPEEKQHWLGKIAQYAKVEWADKPSLFAEWAVSHMPSSGVLVELGSGAGQDSVWFTSKGYKVIQTDIVDTAFGRSRDLAKRYSVEIEQRVVDLWKPLPFEDSSVDVIYAQLSLHYFPKAQTEKIFSEIERVLRPGGVLAALFNSYKDPEYGEGEKLEEDYFQIDNLRKRYFSVESAKSFANRFEIIVADDQGETYKDRAIGVTNLIRLVAKKV